MSVLRKNTLVIDFCVLPKRPDAGVVQQFIEKKIKLQLVDTKNIQLHNIRNCVYIETIDGETALRYERANYNKHSIVCNNKEFRIPVYVESDAVTVRVHDLPSHTQHMTVINYMQQYGVVISITRERWKHYFPGIYNGLRVLRMKLNRPIPSCVTIDGETTLVTYRNQPKTCKHCGESVHPKQKYAKRMVNHNETQQQATPGGGSGPQLDEEAFPSLSAAPTKQSNPENDETQQNESNNKNNATSDNGIDRDDGDCNDDDDSNGDDDETGHDDDSSDRSDNDDFIEAVHQKRRMSKRLLNKKTSDVKKLCISQGRQNFVENSNRFQPLVETDSIHPSGVETKAFSSRSSSKNNKCNSSM